MKCQWRRFLGSLAQAIREVIQIDELGERLAEKSLSSRDAVQPAQTRVWFLRIAARIKPYEVRDHHFNDATTSFKLHYFQGADSERF